MRRAPRKHHVENAVSRVRLFLVFYVFVVCPFALYTGALAIRNIFDLDSASTVEPFLGRGGASFGRRSARSVDEEPSGWAGKV